MTPPSSEYPLVGPILPETSDVVPVEVVVGGSSPVEAEARAARELGVLGRLRGRRTCGRAHTVLYPWEFSDWIVTVRPGLGRERRVRYTVAVDGVRPFCRLAPSWPPTGAVVVDSSMVLPPRLEAGGSDTEALERILADVQRRYRPLRVPEATKQEEQTVFVPVHIVEVAGEQPAGWLVVDPVDGLIRRLDRRRELWRFLVERGRVQGAVA